MAQDIKPHQPTPGQPASKIKLPPPPIGHSARPGQGSPATPSQRPTIQPPAAHKSDEELLNDAIPIESLLEEEAAKEASETVPTAEAKAAGFEAIELADEDHSKTREIRLFDKGKKHADQWQRPLNKTGTGATHVRTFVAKLRMDAIENLDEQINRWLDEHPEYEVKFSNVVIGEMTGKLKEPALFLSVWV